MERIMSVEDKIRRAEEIYERRRRGEERPVAKVNVSNKKDIKLLKKMVIQIVICVCIYLAIYVVQNNKYVFSEPFIQKINQVISYDTNFIELYENVKNQVMGIINNNNNKNTEENKEGDNAVSENSIGGAEEIGQNESALNEDKTQENELSQEDKDIAEIKKSTSVIKPVEGIISSKYGQRDSDIESIPKNHTGTDIAAVIGTKIKSATEGEVVLVSEEGDFRKAF